jgi:hypothetical protein
MGRVLALALLILGAVHGQSPATLLPQIAASMAAPVLHHQVTPMSYAAAGSGSGHKLMGWTS